MRFSKPIWSPVETDYLKTNREKMPLNQLTIALGKSRNAITRKLAELDGKPITKKKNKRSVIGKRVDLDQFFRSNWEANVARWLNEQNRPWKYEPKVFSFIDHGIKQGTMTYTPDFKVGTAWVEVKGLLTPQGKTAIRRFKKFFPEEFKKLKGIPGRPGTKADLFFKSMGIPIMAYMNELDKKYKKTLLEWE